MRFAVTFTAVGGYAVQQPIPDGLALLAVLREHGINETADPRGPASYADFDGDPHVWLNEQQAVAAGPLFRNDTGAQVLVDDDQLARYVQHAVYVMPNGRPLVAATLDQLRLLEDWFAVGAPADWRSNESQERDPDPRIPDADED